MPEQDRRTQDAIEEMRRRRQPMTLRELIIRIIAEAEGQRTVNGRMRQPERGQ